MTNEERLENLHKQCTKAWWDESFKNEKHVDLDDLYFVTQMSRVTAEELLTRHGIVNNVVSYSYVEFGYFWSDHRVDGPMYPATCFYNAATDNYLALRNWDKWFPIFEDNKLAKGIVRIAIWNDKAKVYI